MVRAKVLAVAAAALAVGLTACSPGGSGGPAAGEDARQPVVGDDAGNNAVVPSAAPDEGSTAPQQDGQAVGDPLCGASDLTLAFGEADSAAGSTYQPLIFTNVSPHNCVLHGFPGVSYVGGEDGHQIGEAAFRDGKKGEEINLASGDKASAIIKFARVENFDPAQCQAEPAKGLRVYPPQETASLFIPFDQERNGCAGEGVPSHQLTVQTIQPGVAG
ncbi:DUF4232 domain-containing protein [Saccharopolyspora hordei]|nr:DUF4232 domain-containing protein [Saccharopolyspora hordei]